MNHLRVYQEQPLEPRPPDTDSADLAALRRIFEAATGWSLNLSPSKKPIHASEPASSAPVNPGVGTPPRHASLAPARSASATGPGDPAPVAELAEAIVRLIDNLSETRTALREREADLAAAVPVVVRKDDNRKLGSHLESLLKGLARAIACDSAGLYLLDEATTTLKLRAGFGLSPSKLLEPPRPLEGALADLEAMLGHAVVLDDPTLMKHWRPPETCGAACCVPVASSSTVLGTLWAFSAAPRSFSEQQTEMLEIVAGRIAAELERQVLARDAAEVADFRRQWTAAEELQRALAPQVRPMIPGWDIAHATVPRDALVGCFFDWTANAAGQIVLTLGDGGERGLRGALSATLLRTALRCHARTARGPARILRETNATLWTASAGDNTAAAFCGLLDSDAPLRLSTAGPLACWFFGRESVRPIAATAASPLGHSPDSSYRQASLPFGVGDVLLVSSPLPRLEQAVREKAIGRPSLNASATDWVQYFRSLIEARKGEAEQPFTLLALKRTSP